MAVVDMEVTVTNFNYSQDLQDPTSDAFLSFQDHFRREVSVPTVSPRGGVTTLSGHQE